MNSRPSARPLCPEQKKLIPGQLTVVGTKFESGQVEQLLVYGRQPSSRPSNSEREPSHQRICEW